MCVCSCVDSCDHHHRDPLCCPFIATAISLPPHTHYLIPGDHQSVYHLIYFVILRMSYKRNYTVYNFIRLTFSISVISLRFIQLVACIYSSFSFAAEWYSMISYISFWRPGCLLRKILLFELFCPTGNFVFSQTAFKNFFLVFNF